MEDGVHVGLTGRAGENRKRRRRKENAQADRGDCVACPCGTVMKALGREAEDINPMSVHGEEAPEEEVEEAQKILEMALGKPCKLEKNQGGR